MMESLGDMHVADGEVVAAKDIVRAVTAGVLLYDDGARQVFDPSGSTTYTDRGGDSVGSWSADGGFCSFWPPSYRACYDLRWIVANNSVVGLTFVDATRGTQFAGRYQQ
ncbi:MAG TPA: hypothetical protein VFH76_13060 [Kribbella sp.]|nr:hypothetical protein [Kribbella sp.]